ncbi:hypothetical protein GCM10007933_22070 [Zoogloea oryzae]|uniref:DNA-binding protein n=2 Tax=Zoogloea oryzae TaxID=310767 RepID=A0ABQ6FB24_9RHOO|nr:hypothetical protein GCM10007933_22070 [Zoogloea oryzae]
MYVGAKMQKASGSASTPSAPCTLSTAEFAKLHGIQPRSVRQRVSDTGSYYGIRPQKLANRRLLWPAIRVTLDA